MNSILETTQDLIKIRSTKDNQEALDQSIEYVKKFFSDSVDFFVKEYESNGIKSIVVATHDQLEFDVLLSGHLDVVPGSDGQFDPIEKDGKLFGRGAADMKAVDAVMMQVFKDKASDNSQNLSMALILTTDEEIGGQNGARYLVEEIGYRGRVAFVPDASCGPSEPMLVSKGAVHMHLTANGKTAHGSTPWRGENAIDKLIDAYLRIKSEFDNSGKWATTCNLGVINGGEATNQVPDQASMNLDIRFIEDTSRDQILDKVRSLVQDSGIEMQVLVDIDIAVTDKNDKFVKIYEQAVKEVTGQDCKFGNNTAANDGRFFAKQGTPLIITRPISGGAHSQEEWVDIESLNQFYKIYMKALEIIEKEK